MIKFHEGLRYEYPLTPESVVLDVGGFHGNFAYEIAKRYNCHVIVFEPVKEFYEKCLERLKGLPKVSVYNFGVGASLTLTQFKVSGDSTGAFNANAEAKLEMVDIRALDEALTLSPVPVVDLLKLNCEGGEFAILERALDLGLLGRFKNLQVQPHLCAPNAEARWKSICDRLAETHELVYAEPWCWFGWRRK